MPSKTTTTTGNVHDVRTNTGTIDSSRTGTGRRFIFIRHGCASIHSRFHTKQHHDKSSRSSSAPTHGPWLLFTIRRSIRNKQITTWIQRRWWTTNAMASDTHSGSSCGKCHAVTKLAAISNGNKHITECGTTGCHDHISDTVAIHVCGKSAFGATSTTIKITGWSIIVSTSLGQRSSCYRFGTTVAIASTTMTGK